MSLGPEHIASQADRSREMIAALAGKETTENGSATSENERDTESAQDTSAAEQQTGQTAEGLNTQTEESNHANSADREAEYAPWRTKYNVLKGKYDVEVPRLHAQVRELTAERDRLKTELASAQTKNERSTHGSDSLQDIAPEAFEEYGEEFKHLAGTVELSRKKTETLEEKLGRLEKQADADALERFYAGLMAAAPQADQLNSDPGFLGWLSELNPYDPDGRTRQECLSKAAERRDARTVAAFFNTYAQIIGATDNPPREKAPIRPHTPNVQPGKTAGAPGTPPNKKFWTRADIAKAFDDVRLKRGEWTRETLLAEITLAQKEGRVRT